MCEDQLQLHSPIMHIPSVSGVSSKHFFCNGAIKQIYFAEEFPQPIGTEKHTGYMHCLNNLLSHMCTCTQICQVMYQFYMLKGRKWSLAFIFTLSALQQIISYQPCVIGFNLAFRYWILHHPNHLNCLNKSSENYSVQS